MLFWSDRPIQSNSTRLSCTSWFGLGDMYCIEHIVYHMHSVSQPIPLTGFGDIFAGVMVKYVTVCNRPCTFLDRCFIDRQTEIELRPWGRFSRLNACIPLRFDGAWWEGPWGQRSLVRYNTYSLCWPLIDRLFYATRLTVPKSGTSERLHVAASLVSSRTHGSYSGKQRNEWCWRYKQWSSSSIDDSPVTSHHWPPGLIIVISFSLEVCIAAFLLGVLNVKNENS